MSGQWLCGYQLQWLWFLGNRGGFKVICPCCSGRRGQWGWHFLAAGYGSKASYQQVRNPQGGGWPLSGLLGSIPSKECSAGDTDDERYTFSQGRGSPAPHLRMTRCWLWKLLSLRIMITSPGTPCKKDGFWLQPISPNIYSEDSTSFEWKIQLYSVNIGGLIAVDQSFVHI